MRLLELASGKRKREIELLVAEIAPKPDVPSRMRKLPEARTSRGAEREVVVTRASVQLASFETTPAPAGVPTVAPRVEASDAAFALKAPRPRGSTKPLGPGRYKVEFTAGQALHDKLMQLQELLRHQVPDGELVVIVERAVDYGTEFMRSKRELAQESRSELGPGTSGSSLIRGCPSSRRLQGGSQE